MEPFFFGPSDRQIFAIYHPAIGGSGNNPLTVLCPPLLNEYMRTHAALRELAIHLAEGGQHVLRIDYRGTGDSYGDLDDVTVADWVEDIVLAVQEGRDLKGPGPVRLLGVRAGALLACRAAVRCQAVERVVLWDPAKSGDHFLRGLHRMHASMLAAHRGLGRVDRREASQEHAGHRLSADLQSGLRELDESIYAQLPRNALQVVCTTPQCDFPVEGAAVDTVGFACNWETDLENLIVPRLVLERLNAWLTAP